MTIKQNMRAKKCLNHNRGVTFLVSPRRTQSCTSVKLPTQAIVNRPTHLTLTVAPSPTPEVTNQNHQDGWKAFAGPCSCWFMKLVQASAVRAVKMTSGESRRIRRDWVTSALSSNG
ncbi:Dolichyl-phosphate-mannose--protein mannosyltransferase 1 [Alternaria alternata]|nr:Dolichyl-phosphate-mannose--protein mannosyltransferase 1 [Alternaria alternata]